jgi:D-specific alpha-keto acid dehydrogenase
MADPVLSSTVRAGSYRRDIEFRIRDGNVRLPRLVVRPERQEDPMTYSEPARTTAYATRLPIPSLPTAAAMTGITVYGCEEDECVLFREMAARLGVTLTMTESAISEALVELARGTRCISVGHKTPVMNSTLRALSQTGVGYVSTRSIGYDHIDVGYAASVGITVENVAYSPDSVADYTLMLILMAVRNAKSMLRRAALHDFRLNTVRGKELCDLTVGVVGTGRIGAAVIDRLRGFGCRILAHDNRPKTSADYVSLDELLRQSDIITLHTPLNAGTHHLIDRPRFAQLKRGAFMINTGRGALLDTEALIEALESGKLGGAALDVLEGEEGIFYADCRTKPIENDLLLRLEQCPNVLITPHTAYYTEHALRDTIANSLTNCLEFERRAARE